jgi:hypothetical protein
VEISVLLIFLYDCVSLREYICIESLECSGSSELSLSLGVTCVGDRNNKESGDKSPHSKVISRPSGAVENKSSPKPRASPWADILPGRWPCFYSVFSANSAVSPNFFPCVAAPLRESNIFIHWRKSRQ